MAQKKQTKEWEWRYGLEGVLGELNAHNKNVYHHIKRIDKHLAEINGSVRKHDIIISKWKGVAIGVIAVSTLVSSIVGLIIK